MAAVSLRSVYISVALLVFVAGCFFVFEEIDFFKSIPNKLSKFIEPGKLSKFHANIEQNCNQCHVPYLGVIRDRCVVCHAAPTELLEKQNTTFHSSITSCTGCHFEHQGRDASITKMDHTHFALVAREMSKNGNLNSQNMKFENILIPESARKSYHGTDFALEKTLNCVSCHANQDKHRSLFGNDCSSCHNTSDWTISSFSHPPSTNRDCSQCHQAPPSHYMMHFKMISMKVAGVEHAEVNQCYLCHQTTVWNDIRGVGYYKHH